MIQDKDATSDMCDKHRQPLVMFCNDSNCQITVCHTCVLLKHRDHEVMVQDREPTSDMCDKHHQPLVIFCNDDNCQKVVCQTCVLLKHRDHEVMEVSEKVLENKKVIENIQNAAGKVIENNAKHIGCLEEIKNDISISANTAFDKIEAEKNKLIAIIEKEAAEHTKKVLELQESEVKKVEKTCNDILAKNAKLEQTRELIENLLPNDDINEILKHQATIKQLYKEGLSTKMDAQKRIKHYDTVNFEVAARKAGQNRMIGAVSSKRNKVDYPFIDGTGTELEDVLGISTTSGQDRRRNIQLTGLEGSSHRQVTATKVKSWNTYGWHLSSSSPTGRIYAYGDYTIQAFDLDGNLKMEKRVTAGWIRGMTCHYIDGRDMLVLAVDSERIQLHDGSTGVRLDTLNIHGSNPLKAICQESPGKVLAIISEVRWQPKLIECDIRNNKIIRRNKGIEINIDQTDYMDMTLARSNNRKICVVTCRVKGSSIVACDPGSGEQLWKITQSGLKLNATGKEVDPRQLCTDDKGHLYVVDQDNSRVVVMDTQGQIQKEICTDMFGYCTGVTCISDRNKLIVSDRYPNIYVYDIKYE